MRFYRMHDAEPSGMHATPFAELGDWNKRGYGIFATVQSFDGPRRLENLTKICAWAIDLDEGTKAEQRERLRRTPLKPSLVVETKGGYHAYWFAADAKAQNYRVLVTRLVEFFDADPRARDLARVLRVPGYWHCKDPSDPFLVREVWRCDAAVYRERQLAAQFPPSVDERRAERRKSGGHATTSVSFPSASGDFWARAFDLDAREALPRLSGHWLVGGERFELRPQHNGNANIWVDGKSTSCFVDEQGKIGSGDRGGPGVAQWCHWYQRDYSAVKRGLLEVFPELERGAA